MNGSQIMKPDTKNYEEQRMNETMRKEFEDNNRLNTVVSRLADFYREDLLMLVQRLSDDVAELQNSRNLDKEEARKILHTLVDEV